MSTASPKYRHRLPQLDADDPVDLAHRHQPIFTTIPHLSVLGGCCGTDHRHVDHLASAWLANA